MDSHPNTRLTRVRRERLIRQHLDEGLPLKALALRAFTAGRWPKPTALIQRSRGQQGRSGAYWSGSLEEARVVIH